MARLGLKRQAPISLWETGDTLPKPESIVRMAAALHCRAADLLEGVETPYDRLRAGKGLVTRARAPSEPRSARSVRARSA